MAGNSRSDVEDVDLSVLLQRDLAGGLRWTSDANWNLSDDLKLLERVGESTSSHLACNIGYQCVQWENVMFYNHLADECRKRCAMIFSQLRAHKTLLEMCDGFLDNGFDLEDPPTKEQEELENSFAKLPN